MQTKHESLPIKEGSILAKVDASDIKDGIFNCPDEVEIIKTGAFSSCRELITVTNLNNVKYIEPQAFIACPNLTTVNAPEVETIEIFAFRRCSKLITVDLPKAITIEVGVFSNCEALTVVNLPQVKVLEREAFDSCAKLATIDLPKVVELGNECFCECTALTTVNAPQLEELGSHAFLGCEKLVALNLSKLIAIKEYTFSNCSQLTTLILNPLVKINFWVTRDKDLKFMYENLKDIIIDDLKNCTFDKDAFITQLPPHLKNVKITLASKLPIENLWYTKEVLKQHAGIRDTKQYIFSLYSQLPFFSTVEEQTSPSSDLPSAISHLAS